MNAQSHFNSMPSIFGLGLSPLVELSVTGFVSLWLTKQLLFGKGLYRKQKHGKKNQETAAFFLSSPDDLCRSFFYGAFQPAGNLFRDILQFLIL